MNDLISRSAAINAVEESRRLNHHTDRKAACDHENEHRHFLNILNGLPPADRWTPVTEGLPKRSGRYLVTVTNSEGKTSVDRETYFFDGKHNPLAPEKEANFVSGYLIEELPDGFVGWCFYQEFEGGYGSLCEEGRTVLAWMPLPEPYKKDAPESNDDDAAHYLLKKHSEMALKELEGAWRLAEARHKHSNN